MTKTEKEIEALYREFLDEIAKFKKEYKRITGNTKRNR